MSSFRLPSLSVPAFLERDTSVGSVIDVRMPHKLAADPQTFAGAVWYDPLTLRPDHPAMNREPLYVICAKGEEASHYAVALARLSGRQAYVVTGGLDALRAAGAPMVPVHA